MTLKLRILICCGIILIWLVFANIELIAEHIDIKILQMTYHFYNEFNVTKQIQNVTVSNSLYIMIPALYSPNTYYYIQRVLCSTIFSSNILPSNIHISIDNMQRTLFKDETLLFQNMIHTFNQYLPINFHLHYRDINKSAPSKHQWGGNKNFLFSKIKEMTNNESITIQVLDVDDIYNPYLLPYIDYIINHLDTNNNMNSYLHKFYQNECRFDHKQHNYLFDISFETNKYYFDLNSYLSQCKAFNTFTRSTWFDMEWFYKENENESELHDMYLLDDIAQNLKLIPFEHRGCARSVGNGWITTTYKLLNITNAFRGSGRLEDCDFISKIHEYGGKIYVMNPLISVYCRGVDASHKTAAFVKLED